MKKLMLYFDTSIFNFVIAKDVPYEREVTVKLLDEIKKGIYAVFISEVVIREVNNAPQKIMLQLKELIQEVNPEEVPINEEVQSLADTYINNSIIPAKYRDDALHIAAASVSNLAVIVRWNFTHIVKLKTKREVTGINVISGYKEIEIYSPLEVVEND
jgi:predicted nucleic acid-binding protein